MCLSCGCKEPDNAHGDMRFIVMQDIVDAAEADAASVEHTWHNLEETMKLVLSGQLQSKVWKRQGDANPSQPR